LGTLASGPNEWREKRDELLRQRHFVDKLVQLMEKVRRESGNRQRKIERLQALLKDTTVSEGDFTSF